MDTVSVTVCQNIVPQIPAHTHTHTYNMGHVVNCMWYMYMFGTCVSNRRGLRCHDSHEVEVDDSVVEVSTRLETVQIKLRYFNVDARTLWLVGQNAVREREK